VSKFRRRRRDAVSGQDETDVAPDETLTSDGGDDDQGDDWDDDRVGDGAPAQGPWDSSEVEDPAAGGRIDLGALWVPGHPGLEVRVEADQATGVLLSVTLVLGEGALQLQPFAAPRSEGIWDDVRVELRAGITKQGGTADEIEGPLGTELRTKVPVRRPDGSSEVAPARFLGIDGPRWFLRGVLTGPPAVDEAEATILLDLLRDVVVVRGVEPMAPRDPIQLRLPDHADQHGPDGPPEDPLNPFRRGPESTEIH
jgi:hypothetical protein